MKSLNCKREPQWACRPIDVRAVGCGRAVEPEQALIEANYQKSELPRLCVHVCICFHTEAPNHTIFCNLPAKLHR